MRTWQNFCLIFSFFSRFILFFPIFISKERFYLGSLISICIQYRVLHNEIQCPLKIAHTSVNAFFPNFGEFLWSKEAEIALISKITHFHLIGYVLLSYWTHSRPVGCVSRASWGWFVLTGFVRSRPPSINCIGKTKTPGINLPTKNNSTEKFMKNSYSYGGAIPKGRCHKYTELPGQVVRIHFCG